jgi:hypothetical protein
VYDCVRACMYVCEIEKERNIVYLAKRERERVSRELCPVSCPTVSSDVALLDAKEKGKMECVSVCVKERERERERVCVLER